MNNKTIMNVGKVALYAGGLIAFALSFLGGFMVETYLGVKIYGEVYMQRLMSMLDSPAEIAFLVIACSFCMVVIARHFIRPAVNDILKKIES